MGPPRATVWGSPRGTAPRTITESTDCSGDAAAAGGRRRGRVRRRSARRALESEQLLEAIHQRDVFAGAVEALENVEALRDRRHRADAELTRAAGDRVFAAAPYQDCARGRIHRDVETVLRTIV